MDKLYPMGMFGNSLQSAEKGYCYRIAEEFLEGNQSHPPHS
jgi:hypothetical protein